MRLLDIATYFTPDYHPSPPVDDPDLYRLYAYPESVTRPWIRANFVSSIDGAVSADGVSAGLGTPSDQAVFDTLRTLADAVLVGAGTVRSEDYGGVQLTEAQRRLRTAAGRSAVPPIVVVTASASIDPQARLLVDTEVPPIVLTSASAPATARDGLRDAGASVIEIAGSSVPTHAILSTLENLGLRRILCEGGPGLFGTLLVDDAVDELCITTSPVLVAGGAGRISSARAAATRRMTRAHVLADDDGTLLTRWVKNAPGGVAERRSADE